MTIPVLICDDSGFARKQMARALPENWDIEISYSANGEECIEAIKEGKADVLFLDLNMPVMDGYEVLQIVREMDLSTMIIVVSGDVQPEAYERVIAFGAMDFIKKPASPEKISDILKKYGIHDQASVGNRQIDMEVSVWDSYQEIANVAMGQAAELLAKMLGVFVHAPIPKISMATQREIEKRITQMDEHDSISVVSQGFIGKGIAGEALLVLKDSSYEDLTKISGQQGLGESSHLDMLLGVAGILIGPCLNGIANQFDIHFSLGHPVVVGTRIGGGNAEGNSNGNENQILIMEMSYTVEDHDVNCSLMLLFTKDSIESLSDFASLLTE
ncbi:MAG: response regulator [Pseudomonadales bacterium]|nr:response regulator [Pseudomonadales bacterium]